jgi:hypothetical protein
MSGSARQALTGDCIVVANHETAYDAGVGLAISRRVGSSFRHLAAEHVLIERPWLARLGLFSLPERGDAFARLNAIDNVIESWAAVTPIHLWVMPSEGHWPIARSGEMTSVATVMANSLEDRSPTFVFCALRYLSFTFRRPTVLAWLECAESQEEVHAQSVQAHLIEVQQHGEVYFQGAGPLEALIGRHETAIVAGLPVQVGLVRSAVQSVRAGARIEVQSGRLTIDRPVGADEVPRVRSELRHVTGPNLGEAIVEALSMKREGLVNG